MDASWVGRGVGLGAVKRQNFRESEADPFVVQASQHAD